MKEENDENCFTDPILSAQNMITFHFLEKLNGCLRVEHILGLCPGFPLVPHVSLHCGNGFKDYNLLTLSFKCIDKV